MAEPLDEDRVREIVREETGLLRSPVETMHDSVMKIGDDVGAIRTDVNAQTQLLREHTRVLTEIRDDLSQ